MKEELKNVIYALSGALLGGGLSFIFTRAHVQKKYVKQVNDLSSMVAKMEKEKNEAELVQKEAEEEYNAVLNKYEQAVKDSLDTKMKEVKSGIREVGNEEFLNIEYDIRYLNYYEDGIVTDDRDVVIERPESYLGPFYEDFFTEKVEGIVHIVNDTIKEKYSIAICNEPFMDDISYDSEGNYPTDNDA